MLNLQCCPIETKLPAYRVRSILLRSTICLAFFFAIVSCAEAESNFNRDILPILAEQCFTCHGFDKGTRKAGLRLDNSVGATSTLESGARAVVPGNLASSALVARISSADPDFVMPPASTGRSLSTVQKAALQKWISDGARYEPHWSFIAPRATEPPHVPGVEPAIDRFILGRLEAENLRPSSPADRGTLIRRASLDLIGLPPTPLEVDAFVHDSRTDAFERVVDRLLASEHFGERWARWWLDLAHYADSDGYLQDMLRPVAWRYRQWVVDAFNRDMPFDQFTVEQIAGDLLPNATISQRIATGFLRNTLSNREGGADLEEFRVRQAIDRTASVGTTWLGLTIACAECHDHKFDPISQKEFYQLYAFFNNVDEVNMDAPLPGELEPWQLAKTEYDQKRAALVAPLAAEIEKLQSEWERRLLRAEAHPGSDGKWDRVYEVLGLIWGQGLGEGQLEGINIVKLLRSQRTADQQARLVDYFISRDARQIEGADYKVLEQLSAKLEALKKDLPKLSRAPAVAQPHAARKTRVHVRGDFRRLGDEVHCAIPTALQSPSPELPSNRLDLARWLVSPGHPLTARVTVNRIWHELFGKGLVATTENFGARGEPPSHPELLDWLAIEFQKQSWSLKDFLRTIVLSRTYRQSSSRAHEHSARDPLNRLLARQTRLRLSAETIRDAALAVSGLLNATVGGPCVRPPQPESVAKEGFDNTWIASGGADRYRRGLYTFIQRTSPYAQFVNFDLPDTSRSCTRRERSNTPLQALNLLNDPVFFEAAQALARRILRERRGSDQSRLEHAYCLALSRPPKAEESKRMLDYLSMQQEIFVADVPAASELSSVDSPESASVAAWVMVASVLLNLDEFVNRE